MDSSGARAGSAKIHSESLHGAALVAGQACLASDVVNSHAVFLRADDNCRVDNNKTGVRCDLLAHRFRAAHVRSDAWISLFIDNAKYETIPGHGGRHDAGRSLI